MWEEGGEWGVISTGSLDCSMHWTNTLWGVFSCLNILPSILSNLSLAFTQSSVHYSLACLQTLSASTVHVQSVSYLSRQYRHDPRRSWRPTVGRSMCWWTASRLRDLFSSIHRTRKIRPLLHSRYRCHCTCSVITAIVNHSDGIIIDGMNAAGTKPQSLEESEWTCSKFN